jgi:hypothetical protein
MAFAWAPRGVLAKSQLFRPVTQGVMARLLWLLSTARRASSRNRVQGGPVIQDTGHCLAQGALGHGLVFLGLQHRAHGASTGRLRVCRSAGFRARSSRSIRQIV